MVSAAVQESDGRWGRLWLVSAAHGGTHWIMATFFISLPFVAEDLGLSYTQVGFLVSTYYISSFLANFASGLTVDLFGNRVLIQGLTLIVGALAILGFSISNSYALLCLMIAMVGASNSFWHPAAISYLSLAYPTRRGYALSIHALFANLADAVAPLLAGLLIAVIAWKGTTAMSAIPSLVAAAMLFIFLSGENRQERRVATSRMDMRGYRDGMTTLLRDRAVVGLALTGGLRSMAQSGLLVFLPLYLANELGVGPIMLGVALMTMQLGGMIASPIAGVVSDRIGRWPVVMAGTALTTAVVITITFIGDTLLFIGAISVLGFVLFALRPVIQSWMMDIVPPHFGASGTSLVFGAQSCMATVTPIIGGFIADSYGLVNVFYFIAAAMLCANLTVMLLPKDKPSAVRSSPAG